MPIPAKVRASRRRDALRAQGLRRIELWVVDTRSPEFKKAAREQSLRLAASAEEDEVMRFIESVQDLGEP